MDKRKLGNLTVYGHRRDVNMGSEYMDEGGSL